MRVLMMGAAALLVACTAASKAGAQGVDDLAGTWAFQTTPYGSQQVRAYMSGVAVMTETGPGRYDIRLMANERLTSRVTGQTRLLVARQSCSGEMVGEQFTITCELAEPFEGYTPDNFLLQRGEESDQLVGVLSSNAEAQATFTRMR